MSGPWWIWPLLLLTAAAAAARWHGCRAGAAAPPRPAPGRGGASGQAPAGDSRAGLLLAATLCLLDALYGPTWTTLGYGLLTFFLLLVALIDLFYRVVPNASIYPALAAAGAVGHPSGAPAPLLTLLGGLLAGLLFVAACDLPGAGWAAGTSSWPPSSACCFGLPDLFAALLLGVGSGALVAWRCCSAGDRPGARSPLRPISASAPSSPSCCSPSGTEPPRSPVLRYCIAVIITCPTPPLPILET